MRGLAVLDHIDTLTDLLMGAAYADTRLDGRELATIRQLLECVVDESPLPADLEARMKAFDPAAYDPKAAAGTLGFLSAEDKHTVVDLIATVNEADEEIDMAEDAYLRSVALGLGLSEEEIEAYTVTLVDEELPGLLAKPPPPPPAAAKPPPPPAAAKPPPPPAAAKPPPPPGKKPPPPPGKK